MKYTKDQILSAEFSSLCAVNAHQIVQVANGRFPPQSIKVYPNSWRLVEYGRLPQRIAVIKFSFRPPE